MLRSPCVATVGFSNRAKNLQRLTGHAENLGYFLPGGAIWKDIFAVDSATVPQKRKNPVVRSPGMGVGRWAIDLPRLAANRLQ